MPNKIDITQTNTQLNTYITVWSGSNLTGPSRSVPIYNSLGTASVAQAISDEYYLVRRGGEIIWAPIVSGGGSTLMFSLSPITEESSNEPIGYVSVSNGLVSDAFLFQDVERVFDYTRISMGNPYDAFLFQDVERIFDYTRISMGNPYDSFVFQDVERVFDFNRISMGNPYDAFEFQDVERVFDFNRIDIGTLNVITGQETEALAIYATPLRDVTFYDDIFIDGESVTFLDIDRTINSSGGTFV